MAELERITRKEQKKLKESILEAGYFWDKREIEYAKFPRLAINYSMLARDLKLQPVYVANAFNQGKPVFKHLAEKIWQLLNNQKQYSYEKNRS